MIPSLNGTLCLTDNVTRGEVLQAMVNYGREYTKANGLLTSFQRLTS
jgi:hypothetical protein